jgi:hypothetical protein
MATATKLKSPPHSSNGDCPICAPSPPPQHPDACGHWGHFHVMSTDYQKGKTAVTWQCDICDPDLFGC